jgi:hypothetical protein
MFFGEFSKVFSASHCPWLGQRAWTGHPEDRRHARSFIVYDNLKEGHLAEK